MPGACFTVQIANVAGLCRKFTGMASKWKSDDKTPPRSVSAVLLDFVFGEPLPQPHVDERDDEQAWQDWLNAIADREAVIEFEDTRPTPRQ